MTPYILEKDGEYISFPSEKSACEFLGVAQCTVASYYRHGKPYKGYNIIKAKSEWDVYMDKRLWKIWSSMHERCERKAHTHFESYGGRGICVCDEWRDYVEFAKWSFANGYSDDLTIDRIDNNGNYEPSNCRWVTVKEQQNNRRNNRRITYQGETYTLAQLAEKIGMNKTTLKERLNAGWSIEDAVEKPIRKRTKGWRQSA